MLDCWILGYCAFLSLLQNDTSPSEPGLGWVDFDFDFEPGSAWADGKLAELAEQLGKMV